MDCPQVSKTQTVSGLKSIHSHFAAKNLEVEPSIDCEHDYQGYDQYQSVYSGIQGARHYAITALSQVARGEQSPAFRAIFKTSERDPRLIDTFSYTHVLPKTRGQAPRFICLNSMEDAQRSGVAAVWNTCAQWGIWLYPNQSALDSFLMYICPRFHSHYRDEGLQPQADACPDVSENRFSGSLRWVNSKAIVCLGSLLRYYGRLREDPQIRIFANTIAALNNIMGLSNEQAASNFLAYAALSICKWSGLYDNEIACSESL